MSENNNTLPNARNHDSFEDARQQAADSIGFIASERIKGFEIPNPSLLSDDQRRRIDKLNLEVESWQHHPDEFTETARKQLTAQISKAPSAADLDGSVVNQLVDVFIAFAKQYRGLIMTPGELKQPHRDKDGQPVDHYEIQQAMALLGDQYEAFNKAGGQASDVTVTWWKMNKALAERHAEDSKSVSGDRPVEPVSKADPV